MAMFNVADFVKIGVLAFIFIFIVNRGLDKMGLGAFQA